MLKPIAALLITSTFLAGCASIAQIGPYTPPTQDVSEPALNQTQTAYVGDHLLSQGTYSEREAIEFKSMFKLSGWSYGITAGKFVKTGENSNYDYYTPMEGPKGGKIERYNGLSMISPAIGLQVSKAANDLCIFMLSHEVVCGDDKSPATKTTVRTIDENEFQQTLIYNGMVGNKINIAYREFSGKQARSAFSNDVEYDLSQSKVIGYKGARIEVIKATNENITYRVISNFK
ncbi:hypothetical protein [Aeromonas sp. R1-2]|uniref:hypothetical protein n=1 Tax=Aeromonas sp. R1-2 TaxID=3138456 RepID=UPI0034A2EE6B